MLGSCIDMGHGVHAVVVCIQRPFVAHPKNSHPPTRTPITSHIHSRKNLEPSKAGPQEHMA